MIPPIRVEKRDRSPRPIRPRLLNHRHVYSIRRREVEGGACSKCYVCMRVTREWGKCGHDHVSSEWLIRLN